MSGRASVRKQQLDYLPIQGLQSRMGVEVSLCICIYIYIFIYIYMHYAKRGALSSFIIRIQTKTSMLQCFSRKQQPFGIYFIGGLQKVAFFTWLIPDLAIWQIE